MRRPAFRRALAILAASVVLALAIPVSAPARSGPGRAAIPRSHPAVLYATGTGGAVASAEPVATDAGLVILRAGGNAVDASVAVALALAVVHPQAGNLGGGGFAVIRIHETIAALDFRETAPAGARRDMFLGDGGQPRPGASWIGPLATGVPGSPAGLHALQRRFGRLPWREVVAPAIRLAREGFAVTQRLHDAIEEESELLGKYPETAAVWLPGGKAPEAGAFIRLPDLGRTLSAYADRGPAAITSGPVAASIEAASKARGGILTAVDLASYLPVWRDPLRFKTSGWEVAAMPLPSSGGTIVAETCAILERLGWASLPKGGIDRIHLLAEAWRRAYADRFVLGDPATTLASSAQILDAAWIASRAAGIDRAHAAPSLEVRPWPGTTRVPPQTTSSEASQTTHLSVIDAAGGMVALTTTLNGWFGCGLQVPGAGFLLNNEMDDFTTSPGLPNAYGLVQGDANAVRPGKRMLSSMCPMIAWRGDEEIAIGSPGGSRIPTATIQVLLDLVVDREPLRDAVERPRFHHQWLPDQITVEENALSPEARAELTKRGHVIKATTWRIGEIDVVRSRGASVEAAADPRGPGGAGVVGEPDVSTR